MTFKMTIQSIHAFVVLNKNNYLNHHHNIIGDKKVVKNYSTLFNDNTSIQATASSLSSSSSSSSKDVSSSSKSTTFLSQLLSRFQGDFDNYNQVYSDINQYKLTPKEGGSHEHFHVTLLPLIDDSIIKDVITKNYCGCGGDDDDDDKNVGAVLAVYYFDGIPNRIFRLRLYTFLEECNNDEEDNDTSCCIYMKLYTLHPSLEKQLKQCTTNSDDVLTKWISIIQAFINENDDEIMTELKRCDIKWMKSIDPTRHIYFNTKSNNDSIIRDPTDAFHAIMINDHEKGGVLLESQMAPGLYLRIQDELSLWDDELWVNDRGHDANSGRMVYGNYLSVPYKMKRVTSLESIDKMRGIFRRKITEPSLVWTLGEGYRTSDEYKAKMDAVGGTTTSYNPKKK